MCPGDYSVRGGVVQAPTPMGACAHLPPSDAPLKPFSGLAGWENLFHFLLSEELEVDLFEDHYRGCYQDDGDPGGEA